MKVTYIDHCGSDLSVVNAARVSFDKYHEEFNAKKDEGLIKFLAREGHTSPFNHTFITMHIKAPLFVARQMVKHKFMPWNEVSRRYVDDEPEFYRFPEYRMAAKDKKQGSSDIKVIPKGQAGRCPVCGSDFISNNNRTSYCSSNCQYKGWRSTPEGWKSRKMSSIRQSAVKRGIPVSITEDDIETPTHCVYLGIKLKYGNTKLQGDSASVDRIDNSKGYIPGNIQTISNKANVMKHVASDEEIVKFSKSALMMHGNFMTPQADSLDAYHEEMKRLYLHLVEKENVCPEQARGILPQTLFTEWYWSGTLGAWAGMYNLRAKPDTQKETQEIAFSAGRILADLYPVSWKALTEGK
jgi:thymidylate synthase ThyX